MATPPSINVDAVLMRIKEALGYETDIELSKYLNVSNVTISSWRRRNSMPIEAMLSACVSTGKSIDFFIFGEEVKREPTSFNGFDVDVMQAVGVHIACSLLKEYAEEAFAFMEEGEKKEVGRKIGLMTMMLMDAFMREKKALLDSGKIDKETFIEYITKSDRSDLPYFWEAFKNRPKK